MQLRTAIAKYGLPLTVQCPARGPRTILQPMTPDPEQLLDKRFVKYEIVPAQRPHQGPTSTETWLNFQMDYEFPVLLDG